MASKCWTSLVYLFWLSNFVTGKPVVTNLGNNKLTNPPYDGVVAAGAGGKQLEEHDMKYFSRNHYETNTAPSFSETPNNTEGGDILTVTNSPDKEDHRKDNRMKVTDAFSATQFPSNPLDNRAGVDKLVNEEGSPHSEGVLSLSVEKYANHLNTHVNFTEKQESIDDSTTEEATIGGDTGSSGFTLGTEPLQSSRGILMKLSEEKKSVKEMSSYTSVNSLPGGDELNSQRKSYSKSSDSLTVTGAASRERPAPLLINNWIKSVVNLSQCWAQCLDRHDPLLSPCQKVCRRKHPVNDELTTISPDNHHLLEKNSSDGSTNQVFTMTKLLNRGNNNISDDGQTGGKLDARVILDGKSNNSFHQQLSPRGKLEPIHKLAWSASEAANLKTFPAQEDLEVKVLEKGGKRLVQLEWGRTGSEEPESISFNKTAQVDSKPGENGERESNSSSKKVFVYSVILEETWMNGQRWQLVDQIEARTNTQISLPMSVDVEKEHVLGQRNGKPENHLNQQIISKKILRVLAVSNQGLEKVYAAHLSVEDNPGMINDQQAERKFGESSEKKMTRGMTTKKDNSSTIISTLGKVGSEEKVKKLMSQRITQVDNQLASNLIESPVKITSHLRDADEDEVANEIDLIPPTFKGTSNDSKSWNLRTVSMVHQPFLVATQLKWDFPEEQVNLSSKSYHNSSSEQESPQKQDKCGKRKGENKASDSGQSQFNFLLSWEIFGGGLRGNLVTDTCSASISLWPNTTYIIQVGLITPESNSSLNKTPLSSHVPLLANLKNNSGRDLLSLQQQIPFPFEGEPKVTVKSEKIIVNTTVPQTTLSNHLQTTTRPPFVPQFEEEYFQNDQPEMESPVLYRRPKPAATPSSSSGNDAPESENSSLWSDEDQDESLFARSLAHQNHHRNNDNNRPVSLPQAHTQPRESSPHPKYHSFLTVNNFYQSLFSLSRNALQHKLPSVITISSSGGKSGNGSSLTAVGGLDGNIGPLLIGEFGAANRSGYLLTPSSDNSVRGKLYTVFVIMVISFVIFLFVVAVVGFCVLTTSIKENYKYFVPKKVRVWTTVGQLIKGTRGSSSAEAGGDGGESSKDSQEGSFYPRRLKEDPDEFDEDELDDEDCTSVADTDEDSEDCDCAGESCSDTVKLINEGEESSVELTAILDDEENTSCSNHRFDDRENCENNNPSSYQTTLSGSSCTSSTMAAALSSLKKNFHQRKHHQQENNYHHPNCQHYHKRKSDVTGSSSKNGNMMANQRQEGYY